MIRSLPPAVIGVDRKSRPAGAVVGYVPGVFDMFHVGHLNILHAARARCDHLVAGVVTDDVAFELKGRVPAVPQEERLEVVASMAVVDEVVLELTTDKIAVWEAIGFDVVFKGDDWAGSEKWTQLGEAFAERGVDLVYLPYTRHLSSTSRRHEVGTISRGTRAEE